MVCVLVLPLLSTSLLLNRQINGREDEFEWLANGARNLTTRKVDDYMGSSQRLNAESDNELCPIWFVRGKNGKCECGRDLGGIVQCDLQTNELSVLDCYCITADEIAVVGSCFFNCINLTYDIQNVIYHGAPSDCQSLNREGILCGKCRDGFALPAYSYKLTCIKCDRDQHNWWLYVIYAFVPLSFFIIIIFAFRISVVDPKLYLFVFAAQNIAIPIILRVVVVRIASVEGIPKLVILFLATVYGIWNLDFFRVVLPDICLNIHPLHTLALDYLVGIYPMLVMGVAYIIVELHGCGFRPIMCMCRPFHRYFVRFRRHWGIQTSIMDTFVTFFVLSITKMFNVSYDLLIGTKIFTPEKYVGLYLYYNPSIKLFGTNHLPFALTAIAILIIFIIFPLSLLLCYQCRAFQKCLSKCHLKGNTMDELVNTFQQYYKDGSNGTFDCRWFAGFYIIIKAAGFTAYEFSLSEIAYVLLTCVTIIGAAVVLIVQPYKKEYEVFNIFNAILLLWQALFFASMANEGQSTMLAVRFHTNFIPALILGLVPLIYIIGVVIHHFFKKNNCSRLRTAQPTAFLSSLPDRLLHSDQYRDSFGFIAASQSSQRCEKD